MLVYEEILHIFHHKKIPEKKYTGIRNNNFYAEKITFKNKVIIKVIIKNAYLSGFTDKNSTIITLITFSSVLYIRDIYTDNIKLLSHELIIK